MKKLRRALDGGDASGVFDGDATASVLDELQLHDAARYAEIPVQPGEFGSDENLLALDADGWDKLDLLRAENEGDPTVSFGRGEEGKKNALAYARAIRAGDTEKAAEIARRCRARMPKQTGDSTELVREDRER